jgi:hypothetical protein
MRQARPPGCRLEVAREARRGGGGTAESTLAALSELPRVLALQGLTYIYGAPELESEKKAFVSHICGGHVTLIGAPYI